MNPMTTLTQATWVWMAKPPHLDGVPVDLSEVPDLLLVGAQASAPDVPGQVAEVRVRQHRHVACRRDTGSRHRSMKMLLVPRTFLGKTQQPDTGRLACQGH